MKQKTKQNITISLAIILVTALVLMAICTDGFLNWNKYCLYGHDYGDNGVCVRCGKDKPAEEPEQANGNVIIETVVAQGMQLNAAPVALSDEAETYTLTATITPASADDKRVEWTVAWKNASSLWATGKTVTEYVIVTPTSANALTATVACVQDFGEQIVITVTSLDNEEAMAQCTVDYVQRIKGFTFNVPSVSSATTAITYDIEMSAGTIESEVSITISDKLVMDEHFKSEYLAYVADMKGENASWAEFLDTDVLTISEPYLSLQDNSLVLSSSQPTWEGPEGLVGLFVFYDERDIYYANLTPGDLIAAFRGVLELYPSKYNCAPASFVVTYTATYNGQVYSQGTKTVGINFDGQALHVPVDSLSLSHSSLVF